MHSKYESRSNGFYPTGLHRSSTQQQILLEQAAISYNEESDHLVGDPLLIDEIKLHLHDVIIRLKENSKEEPQLKMTSGPATTQLDIKLGEGALLSTQRRDTNRSS